MLALLYCCVCVYVFAEWKMGPKRKKTPTDDELKKKRDLDEKRVKMATEKKRKEEHPESEDETGPDGSTGRHLGSSHKGETLGDWDCSQMKKGWKMLNDPYNTLSKTKVALAVGVPKTTFMDRIRLLEKKTKKGETLIERDFILQSGGKLLPRALSLNEEEVLKGHITSFGARGFPLVPQEVRTMAHEMTEVSPESAQRERNGGEMSYKWQQGFLTRHTNLKKKIPSQMSLSRAVAPTRLIVSEWFSKYSYLLYAKKIDDPAQVWNIDETGVHENAATGIFIVDQGSRAPMIVAHEKGQTITILSFCNAAGQSSPPMVIMKGKNRQQSWAQFMPRSWHLRASLSGYINRNLFAEYGMIFIHYLHSKGQLEKGNLVLCDGHSTHKYNASFLLTLKKNNIDVLALPAHSSHFLQPLDQTPFASLKHHWKKELRVYNRKKLGVAFAKPQFFLVFPRAWRLGMCPENIRAGFAMAGLWPLDEEAINPEVFLAAEELCKHSVLMLLMLLFSFMHMFGEPVRTGLPNICTVCVVHYHYTYIAYFNLV